MAGRSPLESEIRRRIATAGPMPVAEYMALCLLDREHGYYTTRDPLGPRGDFTTAPEVSQMFGELIGLWAATVWTQMGAPENVRLIELGPGRGTMMNDVLRAVQIVPEFHSAIVVHLVEISPALQSVGVTQGYYLFSAAPYVLTLALMIATCSPARSLRGAPAELGAVK